MLTSLFGDLAPRRATATPSRAPAFADTSIMESPPTGFADTTVMAPPPPAALPRSDPQAMDVFVSGSPAVAIREHFAATRSDLDVATSMITLLDPSRLWAPAVIKALSDATGAPVEKLHLRERGTLRTLAVVARTTVRLRSAGPLRVYHADVRSLGAEHDEIVNALAERSHMAVVIVGAMQAHGLDLMMRALLDATRQPQWKCPRLTFLVPPGALETSHRIMAREWPASLRVSVVSEPLTGASSAWNTVLAAWSNGLDERLPAAAALPAAPVRPADDAALSRALVALARTDSVLGCGVLDLERGDLLLSESRSMNSLNLALMARAMSEARAAHGRACGPGTPVPDELLVTSGAGIDLLRTPPPPGRLGLVVRVDRHLANLALVRFKMLDAEKHLR